MKANRDTISPEFSFDFEKRSRILIFSPGYASSVYTCLIDNKNNFKLFFLFFRVLLLFSFSQIRTSSINDEIYPTLGISE